MSTAAAVVEHSPRARLRADLATRPVDGPDRDPTCGLCGLLLTVVGLRVGASEVLVVSCAPCGWHTRHVDGVPATLEELCDLVRGRPNRLPTRRRLPATWNRR